MPSLLLLAHNERLLPILFRSILIGISLYLILIIPQLSFPTYIVGQTLTTSSLLVVSTRGHYTFPLAGELIQGHNKTDYQYYVNNIPTMQSEIICPKQKEIAIFIHGVWTDETSANEQFNRTAMSLAFNNYTIPLIGFSWNSNTPINREGWEVAKAIAENNGPKLAQFISNFKNKCKDTDIRLIAHSLGAVVVNSTLVALSNNQTWNNNNSFNIKSVHLLGATIDRNATASNTAFGKAIEDIVDNFYNLRNPEDNMLEYVYRHIENHDALGLLGIQHSLPLPRDYSERQVDSEIPPIPDADANGKLDCFDFFVILPGDNHCGYIGFRGLHPFENILRDDGSMDIVVRNWSE